MTYVLLVIPMVHRNILHIPFSPWFLGIFLPFTVLGIFIFGGAKIFAIYLSLTPDRELMMIIPAAIAYIGLGFYFLGTTIRADVVNMFQ